jgi:putative transposase
MLGLVEEAVCAGASVVKACGIAGVSSRSLRRWRSDAGGEDRRRGPSRPPTHKLSRSERERLLRVVNSAEFRDLSPKQIVPRLADCGIYLASESTIYRVLRDAGQLHHREHSRPRRSSRPKAYVARGQNQIWSWDITFLRSPIRGAYFYLYLVVDIWSRKIIAAEVHAEERADIAAGLIERACEGEHVDPGQLVLHADNGPPMKGSTMLTTLRRLGVVPSFSRPSVSDDNPFSEALFRTLKYRPTYPRKPFASATDAASWVQRFVRWYNEEHLHSSIRFVTPSDRHAHRDAALLRRRAKVYARARAETPRRWTGKSRNWNPVGAVFLNPVRADATLVGELALNQSGQQP